jgi:hypothetical protein
LAQHKIICIIQFKVFDNAPISFMPYEVQCRAQNKCNRVKYYFGLMPKKDYSLLLFFVFSTVQGFLVNKWANGIDAFYLELVESLPTLQNADK